MVHNGFQVYGIQRQNGHQRNINEGLHFSFFFDALYLSIKWKEDEKEKQNRHTHIYISHIAYNDSSHTTFNVYRK